MVDTFTSSETCRGKRRNTNRLRAAQQRREAGGWAHARAPGLAEQCTLVRTQSLNHHRPPASPRAKAGLSPSAGRAQGCRELGTELELIPGLSAPSMEPREQGNGGRTNSRASFAQTSTSSYPQCSPHALNMPSRPVGQHPSTLRGGRSAPGVGLTMVKGMNCRMLPRLPCSRQSTHSSMNHCTNWVWVPAVLAPRMEEMSRKRFAGETGQ